MFVFIRQLFIVLVLMLAFGRSLAMKYLSMNNKPCIFKLTPIDLNPDELYFYPSLLA